MKREDLLVGGGLIAGGVGLTLGAYIAKQVARRRIQALTKAAIQTEDPASVSTEALEQLRDISGNDVNIGVMKRDKQDSGYADNAYYNGNPDYKEHTDKLLASEVSGDDGTIALGDKAILPSTVAHELGHSENNRLGIMRNRRTQENIGRGIATASILGGMLGGLYGAYKTKDKKALTNRLMLTAGLAGLGVAAGDLIKGSATVDEESIASDNARRYLKAVNRGEKDSEMDDKLLDYALDTYKAHRNWDVAKALGLSAAAAGGIYLAGKYL